MKNFKRIEILPFEKCDVPHLTQNVNEYFDLSLKSIEQIKLYWIKGESFDQKVTALFQEVFCDHVLEQFIDKKGNEYQHRNFQYVVETSFHPGVTDNSARAVEDAFNLFPNLKGAYKIASGSLFLIEGHLSQEQIKFLSENILSNPLLQRNQIYTKEEFLNSSRFDDYHFPEVKLTTEKVATYNLNISDDQLELLSHKKTWALNLEEMKHIQKYYNDESVKKQRKQLGLTEEPTDVEMEILAQSWSEHCKHKIFAAHIEYDEVEHNEHVIKKKEINGLFKSYIKKATSDVKEKYKKNWLISVFSDNAGIVRFDENIDICIKVETHNSPSALDPYGGALTGILGVNRDILGCGQGARPIANTDVFCFADPQMNKRIKTQLPPKLLQPGRVFKGVHKGVEDGGNKSGIPTVNGAIFFDDDYAGKPLVYCGTVGVLPQKLKSGKDTFGKRQKAGDAIVVIGGSIGKDGIHGATFSSMELTEGAPATVVQIGDPITQKRVNDLLMEARDKELFTSLTDNGAGGISSSIGEMAIVSKGAKIDLAKAPVKYPGLAPYELMISESQERMTLSVAQEKLSEFLSLCDKRSVQSCVLGEFTESGYLDVYYKQERVAYLNLDFLHESLIPMNLKAKWSGPQLRSFWHGEKNRSTLSLTSNFLQESLFTILSRPNIKSKEKWVRQYDHEVQAASIVKPFMGKNKKSPTDAGVIWMAPHGGEEKRGLAVSCGMWPQISHYDTYLMTLYSIDEAVRNFVAVGGDVNKAALLDNFCWPDPVVSKNNPDGPHKLAQLVRSCEAIYDAAMEYAMPFVSGKDSMKNDFHGQGENGEKVKISVQPTLLISAIADIEDCEKITTSDFKNSGDIIFSVGRCDYSKLNTSELTRAFSSESTVPEKVNLKENFELYRVINSLQREDLLESVHDVSDGGIIVSLVECLFGNKLGAKIVLNVNYEPFSYFYNESTGRFIVSVKAENKTKVEKALSSFQLDELGIVTNSEFLEVDIMQARLKWKMSALLNAWEGNREN